MAKCGCAAGSCQCRFADSASVDITGSGSVSDPYTATPRPLLTVNDSPTLALTLDVTDDTASLSAQPLLGADVQVFTSDGFWVKPAGVTFARILLIGGGGGGASGKSTTSGPSTSSHGGSGGDAGQVMSTVLVDTEIPAAATVTIGQGGNGGVPVTNSFGFPGNDGGDTSFDIYTAPGGAGGGINGNSPSHGPEGMPPGQFASGEGAFWSPTWYYLAPGAGGHGESNVYSPTPGGYSHPAQGRRYPDDVGGGEVGGDGRDEPITKMGSGGGGGPGDPSGGFHGGNGGLYGGGGGGGGYAAYNNPSGAGGDGAPGVCVVVSW